LGTVYKTPVIKFHQNFISHSGIIAWKSWQVHFVANACNKEPEVKKASDLALNTHCLILN